MKQPTTSNEELTRLRNRVVMGVVDTPGLRILVVEDNSELVPTVPNSKASKISAS